MFFFAVVGWSKWWDLHHILNWMQTLQLGWGCLTTAQSLCQHEPCYLECISNILLIVCCKFCFHANRFFIMLLWLVPSVTEWNPLSALFYVFTSISVSLLCFLLKLRTCFYYPYSISIFTFILKNLNFQWTSNRSYLLIYLIVFDILLFIWWQANMFLQSLVLEIPLNNSNFRFNYHSLLLLRVVPKRIHRVLCK